MPLALVTRALVVGDGAGRGARRAPMVPLPRDLAASSAAAAEAGRGRAARSSSTCASRPTCAQPAAAPARAAGRRLGRRRPTRAARRARSGRPGGCAGGPSWRCGSSRPASGARPSRPPRRRGPCGADAARRSPTLTALVEAACSPSCPTRSTRSSPRCRRHAPRPARRRRAARRCRPLARALPLRRRPRHRHRGSSRGVDGLVARICVGLPAAVRRARRRRGRRHARPRRRGARRGRPARRRRSGAAAGLDALARLAAREGVHGLRRGPRRPAAARRAARWTPTRRRRRLRRRALARPTPAEAAAWIEGFLAGERAAALHDAALLGVVDGWLARLGGRGSTDVLPLLRRTFAASSRRAPPLGEQVRRLGQPAPSGGDARYGRAATLELARAAPAVATVARLARLRAGADAGAADDGADRDGGGAARPLDEAGALSPRRAGCADGDRRRRGARPRTTPRRATTRWPRSTTRDARTGRPRRVRAARSRAGSATSAATSPPRSCRSCSATPSSGSGCAHLLLEPEMLEAVEPDVHLVGTLLGAQRGDPRARRARRPRAGRAHRSSTTSSERLASAHPRRPSPARSTAPPAPAGRGRATSTGTARSAPTSSTTSPSTARSSPSG